VIDWGAVAIIEFILFVIFAAVFVAVYAFRSRWWSSLIGRLQLALFLLIALLVVGIVAMAFVTVPSWPFAVIGAGLDMVAVGFVVQLVRSQRREQRRKGNSA
jgi:hypothetical protein